MSAVRESSIVRTFVVVVVVVVVVVSVRVPVLVGVGACTKLAP